LLAFYSLDFGQKLRKTPRKLRAVIDPSTSRIAGKKIQYPFLTHQKKGSRFVTLRSAPKSALILILSGSPVPTIFEKAEKGHYDRWKWSYGAGLFHPSYPFIFG